LEVCAIPLLNHSVQFEVVEIVQVQALVLAIQLNHALLALDDGVDVVVDHQTDVA
jgi:hypothetical protein